MKFITLLLSSYYLFQTTAYSQIKENIFPTPQLMEQRRGILHAVAFSISTQLKIDSINQAYIHELFPSANRSMAGTSLLSIKSIDDPNLRQSGAYKIHTDKAGVTIHIYDQASLFYALKTLKQIIRKSERKLSMPYVTVTDFPNIPYRGTVEGFYGKPWSFEDRMRQISFYGDIKMNIYIYGPKDDPYHSTPHWRDPYPTDRARQIIQLTTLAKQNYVDFVWAVHPGKDIQWNRADSLHLLNKFKSMYDLGVRSFAVFFDDISGEGTNPQKQAQLLNYLNGEFIRKYPDIQPLIMCPTEYNKAWASPKPGSYLDILGEQLDTSIRIMWTGNTVVSDIDRPSVDWINKRIKRKAFIWWNYPVNDYKRDQIQMGPVYGNSTDLGNQVSGFVSNPMEHAEASKVGIYGLAMYTWNMAQFDAARAFKGAISYLAPQAQDAFKIFAENNSDLGPNGHGYRRKESERIAPFVKELEKTIFETPANATVTKVKTYFDSIALAPALIKKRIDNQNLITELQPWLSQFELLGTTGSNVIQALTAFNKNSEKENWNSYLKLSKSLNDLKYADAKRTKEAFKTASLVLAPFVNYCIQLFGQKILGIDTTDTSTKPPHEMLVTNHDRISTQPIKITDQSIAILPVLESLTLQPGEYIGLKWIDNRIAKRLNFNFNDSGFEKWGKVEVSGDGVNWIPHSTLLQRNTRNIPLDSSNLQVRFINRSHISHPFSLKDFSVLTQSNFNSKDPSLIADNNLKTFMVLQPGKRLSIPVDKSLNHILYLNSMQQEIILSNSCSPNFYRGSDNFVEIESAKLKNCTIVEVHNTGSQPIYLFELKSF